MPEQIQTKTWFGAALGTLLALSLAVLFRVLLYISCFSENFRKFRRELERLVADHDYWEQDKDKEKKKAEDAADVAAKDAAEAAREIRMGQLIEKAVAAEIERWLENEGKRIKQEIEDGLIKRSGDLLEQGRQESRAEAVKRSRRECQN